MKIAKILADSLYHFFGLVGVFHLSEISMINRSKYSFLIFLALAAILLLVLPAALSKVEMRSGIPFSIGGEKNATLGSTGFIGRADWVFYMIRGFLVLILILFPFYILISLLTSEGRRRLLQQVIIFAILLIGLSLLSNLSQGGKMKETSLTSNLQPPMVMPTATGPEATFVAQTSPWYVYAIAIGLVAFVSTVIVWFFWQYGRRWRMAPKRSLTQIAEEAQNAVDAIQSGGEWRNIVLQCYFQMNQVLFKERGIQREKAFTPREFEQLLTERGFPEPPIRTLTRLFEAVRYGHLGLSGKEKQQAIDSLNSIVQACKGGTYTRT